MAASLTVYINGRPRASYQYEQVHSERVLEFIQLHYPALCREGRVALVAEGADRIAHMFPANTLPAHAGEGEY